MHLKDRFLFGTASFPIETFITHGITKIILGHYKNFRINSVLMLCSLLERRVCDNILASFTTILIQY